MKQKTVTKTAWQRRNDRGPHFATLPSGAVVKFQIADSAMLLRSGKLPEPLRITGQLAAAHETGPEGYMHDLVQTAIFRGGDAQATIAGAISQAVELGHHLIAEMMIEPEVTPEEVAEGVFPELDIRMLLEFAERQRNLDAAGNKLPITILDAERWATFRVERPDDSSAGDGGANGSEVPGSVPDADGDDV